MVESCASVMDAALSNVRVEPRREPPAFCRFSSGFDGLRERQQSRTWGQSQGMDAVTFSKCSEFFFSWWRIGEHGVEIGLSNISRASADSIFYVQEFA